MTRPAAQHSSFVVEDLDGGHLTRLKSSTRKGILTVRITNDDGRSTLALDGEVDLSNAGALEQAIRQLETSAAETITIDLRAMHFIDLSGVRAIVNADARLGGRLQLIKGPPAVHSVFRLSGAEARLPFES